MPAAEERGNAVFPEEEAIDASETEERAEITQFSLADIYRFAAETPIEELSFIQDAFDMNLRSLAKAGAVWERCTLTKQLLKANGGGFYSADARKSAKAQAAAAAEARVLGIALPAMSITGSGTHGIICTLPLLAFGKVLGIKENDLLRAAAISYLVCMYIKEYSGRLSAFCWLRDRRGTGLACALSFLMGGEEKTNGSCGAEYGFLITGMICTGGNPAAA